MTGPNSLYLWEKMTYPQLAELTAEEPVVLLPTGSIEQHGPHLPLNTDINNAYSITLEVARQVRDFPVVIAPPIWWGISPHHLAYPGTISLRLKTFHALLEDICASISKHGFKRIAIVNGHGGNANPLAAIAQELSIQGIFIAVVTYFAMITEELIKIGESPLGGMSHACEMETSLQMILQPELINRNSDAKDIAKPLTPFFQVDMRASGTVYYPYDLKRDSQEGVIGDPTLATPEKGKRIFEAAVTKLVEFVHAYRTMPDR